MSTARTIAPPTSHGRRGDAAGAPSPRPGRLSAAAARRLVDPLAFATPRWRLPRLVSGTGGSGRVAVHAAASRAAGSRWPRTGGPPEDDAGDAGVAQAAERVQIIGRRRPPGSRHRTTERARGCARGPARCRRGSARSGRRRRRPARRRARRRSAARRGARERRPAARVADRGPTASQSPATPRHARSSSGLGRRSRSVSTTRVAPGGEGQPDRVGRIDAAGDLDRDGDAGRDRADRLEIRRRAAPARHRSRRGGRAGRRAPRTARRSARAGRSARRCPRRHRASRRSAIGRPRGRWPG